MRPRAPQPVGLDTVGLLLRFGYRRILNKIRPCSNLIRALIRFKPEATGYGAQRPMTCCATGRESRVSGVTDSGLVGSTALGGVPREQKMLEGHLSRVMYHQGYKYTKMNLELF